MLVYHLTFTLSTLEYTIFAHVDSLENLAVNFWHLFFYLLLSYKSI